jgi:hypothetical protein
MSKKNYFKTILVALYYFCNQPLLAHEIVINPIKFWRIYRHRQLLEECWQYDLIQWFERCWNINDKSGLDNCASLDNDSHSIEI